jgi:hypothetical protein
MEVPEKKALRRQGFLPLGPRFLEGDSDGVALARVVAPHHLGRSVPPFAGTEGRKKQEQPFALRKQLLGEGPDAAARHVQNVQTNQATRIILRAALAHGMNRHADDGPPVSPPFVQAGRRLAHWAPRSVA